MACPRFCGKDADFFFLYTKQNMYEKNGKSYVRKIGSRSDVWNELCFCTSGGLEKQHLVERNGKLVSKKRSEMGKKRFQEQNPFKQPSDLKIDSEPVRVKRPRGPPSRSKPFLF